MFIISFTPVFCLIKNNLNKKRNKKMIEQKNNERYFAPFTFIQDSTKHTVQLLNNLVATKEGLKVVAKIVKGSTEVIKNFQKSSGGLVNPTVCNIHAAATNLNGVLAVFEPIVIIKELVVGDKEGKRPWDYFKKGATIPKGLSWTFKKTGACIEFTKYLHTLQAINVATHLTGLSVVKSCCDIGFATMTIIDRGLAIHQANKSIDGFKGKRENWLSRQKSALNKETKGINYSVIQKLCQENLVKREGKIKSQVDQFNFLLNQEHHLLNKTFSRYLETLDITPDEDPSRLIDQVKETLVHSMTSLEKGPSVQLEQLMDNIPSLKAFIHDPKNMRLGQKYREWKTLNTYNELKEEHVSSDLKTRRFEKYFANKIDGINEKIENQRNSQKKSALMIAFSVSLIALGVLSLAILVTTSFTALPPTLLSVALLSNLIGISRFASEIFIKVKKASEFKEVELPNIRLYSSS